MLLEAATFVVASLVHSGALLTGYEHREARIAEGVIAIALLLGLALTWVRPAWAGAAGLAAQGFALVGTMVGLLMIAVGVGPRTGLDLVYHAAIVVLLVWGLSVAARARGRTGRVTSACPPVR
jgi:multisubunit Na+/H+ antiporter MnhB subunit